MRQELVVQIMLLVLGGGLAKFAFDVYQIRRGRRMEGPERDSLVAKTAESVILTMKTTLDAAQARATAAEARLTASEARAGAAEARAGAAEARVTECEVKIRSLQDEVHQLNDELHGYVHRPTTTRARFGDDSTD